MEAVEAVFEAAPLLRSFFGTSITGCFVAAQVKAVADIAITPTERGFTCPNCGNSDPKTVDVVKRTCGYLGNPQARPMVNGRHKEISARVKHMNGSTIKYEGN